MGRRKKQASHLAQQRSKLGELESREQPEEVGNDEQSEEEEDHE